MTALMLGTTYRSCAESKWKTRGLSGTACSQRPAPSGGSPRPSQRPPHAVKATVMS